MSIQEQVAAVLDRIAEEGGTAYLTYCCPSMQEPEVLTVTPEDSDWTLSLGEGYEVKVRDITRDIFWDLDQVDSFLDSLPCQGADADVSQIHYLYWTN